MIFRMNSNEKVIIDSAWRGLTFLKMAIVNYLLIPYYVRMEEGIEIISRCIRLSDNLDGIRTVYHINL